jgi:hypothetical protein
MDLNVLYKVNIFTDTSYTICKTLEVSQNMMIMKKWSKLADFVFNKPKRSKKRYAGYENE